MLVKSIRCQVDEQNKEQFSRAQAQWQPLRDVPGFLGQVGGWCEQNQNQAWILAFWETPSAYQLFMKEVHDKILTVSGQGKTYSAISVEFFEMDEHPRQIATYFEQSDVVKAEVSQGALKLSWGKGPMKVTFSASARTLHSEFFVCEKILFEKAWRVRG